MTSSVATIGQRIADFDTWRPGYAGASVQVFISTTTTPAALFSDPQMTQALPNPQTLLTQTDINGETYGKWVQPVYTGVPHRLVINMTQNTGIETPPIVGLVGQDLSHAVVQTTRGAYPEDLADALDADIYAIFYGSMDPASGSAAITAVLNRAIGAAASQGGGQVILPSGTLPFTDLTLPQGVVLCGQGESATTLQSVSGASVVTLAGDGSGFRDLTLDGVDLIPNSIGVDWINIASPIFERVAVKRFAIGVRAKGILSGNWSQFSVSNCNTNLDLRGDGDATGTNNGTLVENLAWDGGAVTLSTAGGLVLECIDRPVQQIRVANVQFTGNTSDAVRLTGARGTLLENCTWTSNTSDLMVQDGTNTAQVAINTIQRLTVEGGRFNGGTLNFNGAYSDVIFSKVSFQNASFELSVPITSILLRDCITDAQTTFSGDLTKLLRFSSFDGGTISGVTTSATPIVAWEYVLPPGEVMLVEIMAAARQRDGINRALFSIQAGAYSPLASLPVNVVGALFVAGATITGATSGASARVGAYTSGGLGYGTVSIRDITGTFVTGEVVNDSSGGFGRTSGPVTFGTTVLDAGGQTDVRAAQQSVSGAYTVSIAAAGQAVQVLLGGAASETVDWTLKLTSLVP